MSALWELDEPSRTRRLPSGDRVDIYAMAEGGRLYVPVIADWEIHQSRLEREARQAQPGPPT